MAKQKNLWYRGRKGKYTYYSWKGIPCFREIAVNINQTSATKADSSLFKVASSTAKGFRNMFAPLIMFPKDRRMQLDWVGAVKRWMNARARGQLTSLNDIPFINAFQFHRESNLDDRLHVPITFGQSAEESLIVDMPGFIPKVAIGAPAYTKAIKMKIAAASASLIDGSAIDKYTTELTIPYNHEPFEGQQIVLPLAPLLPNLTLLAIALEYTTIKNSEQHVVNDKKFIPSGVVGGIWRE